MSNAEIFDHAFEEVIGVEGGYVNDPDDRGGETKYGIAKRWYPEEDIKNLTLERAKIIYYTNYWKTKKLDLDRVAEYGANIALELFDTAVNMGVPTAAGCLQTALNLLNRNEKLFPDMKVDRWAGPNTLECMSKVNPKRLLKVLNGLQFMRYYTIVDQDPVQEKYFAGWMKRV